MDDIRHALSDGWDVLNSAVECLNRTTKKTDEIQLELYGLAFAGATLRAGESFLRYRNKAQNTLSGDTADLIDRVCRFYVADAVFSTSKELALLVPDTKHKLTLRTSSFLKSSLAPSAQEALGRQVLSTMRVPLPDLLSDEVNSIRNSVRKVTEKLIVPRAQKIHNENLVIPEDLLDAIRYLGCFGLSVPVRYGGSREHDVEDTLAMLVVTEELSRGSLGAAGSLITRPEILVQALMDGGTETQRQRWLPGIAKGNPLCAISVTEPGTGSDVASIQLKATPAEGGWKLNGSKTWCTLAGKAGLVLVLARTDSEIQPPHRGLSLFVVEKPSTDESSFEFHSQGGGKLSGRAIETIGYRGMHSFDLFFDDFFVPQSCLVGESEGLNKGFYYTMKGFTAGRLQTAARAVGLMEAAWEASVLHTDSRIVFGQKLGSFALTSTKLLRMVTKITAIRQFAYDLIRRPNTRSDSASASMVKLLACRWAEWVTREAIQLHGGLGYATESPVSRYFLDARVLSIFEGSEEVLALRVIGKALLDGRLRSS